MRNNKEISLTLVVPKSKIDIIYRTLYLLLDTAIDGYHNCDVSFVDNNILITDGESLCISILHLKAYDTKYLFIYDAVSALFRNYISIVKIEVN